MWSLLGMINFAHTVRMVDRRSIAKFRQMQCCHGKIGDDEWDLVDEKWQGSIQELVQMIADVPQPKTKKRPHA